MTPANYRLWPPASDVTSSLGAFPSLSGISPIAKEPRIRFHKCNNDFSGPRQFAIHLKCKKQGQNFEITLAAPAKRTVITAPQHTTQLSIRARIFRRRTLSIKSSSIVRLELNIDSKNTKIKNF